MLDDGANFAGIGAETYLPSAETQAQVPTRRTIAGGDDLVVGACDADGDGHDHHVRAGVGTFTAAPTVALKIPPSVPPEPS